MSLSRMFPASRISKVTKRGTEEDEFTVELEEASSLSAPEATEARESVLQILEDSNRRTSVWHDHMNSQLGEQVLRASQLTSESDAETPNRNTGRRANTPRADRSDRRTDGLHTLNEDESHRDEEPPKPLLTRLDSARTSPRDLRPTYAMVMWVCYGALTIWWIVDRFTTNVWPRNGFSIQGKGAGCDFPVPKVAGGDITCGGFNITFLDPDGLKPGTWSVKFYDMCARLSGRYSTLALNLLYITTMHTTWSVLGESSRVNKLINMSGHVAANTTLHYWWGVAICVLTVIHVWSILFPVVFEGYSVEVVPGAFGLPLSERTPSGFRDVDPNTRNVMMQVDDVWRIVEMSVGLAVLMPISYAWLFSKWHWGIHLHNFLAFAYFVDIIRRHSHPHNWVLNGPVFILWLLDNYCALYFRTATPDVYRVTLSDDYMLLLWDQRRNLTAGAQLGQLAADLKGVIGPKFFFRMRRSSPLERAHVFTGMENRLGTDLWPGHAWTSMLVVRIYHNVRSPAYPRPDHISHTHRVHISQNDTDGTTDEADDGALRTLRTWGPFCGDMSARVYERLHYGQSAGPVGIITGGSAVCLLLDAVQEAVLCPSARDLSPMHLAFTCRDAKLFCWITKMVCVFLTHKNARFPLLPSELQITLNLSDMGGKLDRSIASCDFVTQGKPRQAQAAAYAEWLAFEKVRFEVPAPLADIVHIKYGRMRIGDIIPASSEVFFSGSAGLLKAVKRAASNKEWVLHYGPTFDQEANSTSSLHKWLPLDCCRSAAAKIVDASTLTIPPSAPGAGTAEQPARRPQHRPHCQSAPPTQAPGLTKIVSWDVNGGNGDGGAVRASAKS